MFLDITVRFSSLGILGLLAFLTIRDARSVPSMRFMFCMIVSSAATLISYTPDFLIVPEPLENVGRLIDIPGPVFVWLFGLSLFDDSFKLSTRHWVMAFLYCSLVAILRLVQLDLVPTQPLTWLFAIDLVALAMMAHLAIVTLKGRSDDLMERRRRSRTFFVAGLSLAVISYAASDLLLMNALAPLVPTIKAAIIFPIAVWTACWTLRFPPYVLVFETPAHPEYNPLTLRQRQLLNKLEHEMVTQRAYLDSELTIDTLSRRVAATSRSVRELINGHLGHRHFSAYVNAMRIDAVKSALADPQQRDVPILTIALNSGFNSISPFNRAFKAKEGETPSTFRKRQNIQQEIA